VSSDLSREEVDAYAGMTIRSESQGTIAQLAEQLRCTMDALEQAEAALAAQYREGFKDGQMAQARHDGVDYCAEPKPAGRHDWQPTSPGCFTCSHCGGTAVGNLESFGSACSGERSS